MKYPDSEGTIIFDLNHEKKIDKKFKLRFSIMYRDRVASDFYYCDEEKRILVVNTQKEYASSVLAAESSHHSEFTNTSRAEQLIKHDLI